VSFDWRRLVGRESVPDGFTGTLDTDERVLASAPLSGGAGVVVVTPLGLWLPEGRRVGWHLVSKASWDRDALSVIEAEERGTLGEAVLLADRAPVRLALSTPGRVPEIVHRRVTDSIRARSRMEVLDGGGWLLRRAVAGQDGLVLQVRPDPGTDPGSLAPALPRAVHTLEETQ
jgi:hypothetical protein